MTNDDRKKGKTYVIALHEIWFFGGGGDGTGGW